MFLTKQKTINIWIMKAVGLLPLSKLRIKFKWLHPLPNGARAKQNTNSSFFNAEMIITVNALTYVN